MLSTTLAQNSPDISPDWDPIREWVEGSGVDPAIAQANVEVLTDPAEIALRLGWKRYSHVEGWWCGGVEVSTGQPLTIGQFKPRIPWVDPKTQKDAKYLTSKGGYDATALEGYDWPALVRDPLIRAYATEGGKKAGALITCGFPALGLWGVEMGLLAKGKALVPNLDAVACEGRELVLVFDSDIVSKPSVASALNRLACFLMRRRVSVFIALWDPVLGKGIDDVLVNHGKNKVEEIMSAATPVEEWLERNHKVVPLHRGVEILPHSEAAKIAAISLSRQLAWDPNLLIWKVYSEELGLWKESVPAKVLLTVEKVLRGLPGCANGMDLGYCRAVLTFLQGILLVDEWGPNEGDIPLKDGILNSKTMRLRHYTPEDYCCYQLGIRWEDKDKGCQPILDWLNDAAGSSQVAKVLLAWVNTVVNRRVDLQRFLLLVGPGGSGKSTFISLLRQLIGPANCGATELAQLEGNRFELATLADKPLICLSDQGNYRGGWDRLKGIVGQDPMRIERKGIQGSAAQPIRSLIVMAANEMPSGADNSSGVERRRLVVPFSKIVPPHLRRDLESEFQPYLAGLLAEALTISTDEVTRLIRNTNDQVPELALVHRETLIETNPLAAWVDEHLVLDPDSQTPIGRKDQSKEFYLYPSYVDFCLGTGSNPLSLRRFSGQLVDLLKAQLGIPSIKKLNERNRAIKGIVIRNPSDTQPRLISGDCEDCARIVRGLCEAETLTSEESEDCEDYFESQKLDLREDAIQTTATRNFVDPEKKAIQPSQSSHDHHKPLPHKDSSLADIVAQPSHDPRASSQGDESTEMDPPVEMRDYRERISPADWERLVDVRKKQGIGSDQFKEIVAGVLGVNPSEIRGSDLTHHQLTKIHGMLLADIDPDPDPPGGGQPISQNSGDIIDGHPSTLEVISDAEQTSVESKRKDIDPLTPIEPEQWEKIKKSREIYGISLHRFREIGASVLGVSVHEFRGRKINQGQIVEIYAQMEAEAGLDTSTLVDL